MSKYDDLKHEVLNGLEAETSEKQKQKLNKLALMNNIQSELEQIHDSLKKDGIHTNVIVEEDKRSLVSAEDNENLMTYYINSQNFLIISLDKNDRFPSETYGFCNSTDKVEDFDRGEGNYYDSEQKNYIDLEDIIKQNFKELYKKLNNK